MKVTTGAGSQLSVAVAMPVAAGALEASHSTVAAIGTVMTGSVVSTTLMVCVPEIELPHASVAVHVRVIVDSCGQVPGAVASMKVTTGAGSQLSVAVAMPVAAGALEASHSTVAAIGTVITGSVVSTTLMVCAPEIELPHASVAVHVRVIVDSCGQAPGAVASMKVTTGAGSQLSVAVAMPVAAGALEASHSTVAVIGTVITGSVVSTTLMVCVPEIELPHASVAVHVRVIVDSCGQVPGAVASMKVTTGAGSQLSVAVAMPVAAGALEASHSTVAVIGTVITGSVVSTTLMVCVPEIELPHASVAVHVRVMVDSCGQAPGAVASMKVTTGAGSQLSVARRRSPSPPKGVVEDVALERHCRSGQVMTGVGRVDDR